jgi:hypothetical protein
MRLQRSGRAPVLLLVTTGAVPLLTLLTHGSLAVLVIENRRALWPLAPK